MEYIEVQTYLNKLNLFSFKIRYLSINDLCKCCIVCKEWNEIFSHEVIWRDQVSALLINGYHKHKQDFSKLSFKLQCKKLYEDFYGWKGCWFIQGNQSKKIEPKFFISMNRGWKIKKIGKKKY